MKLRPSTLPKLAACACYEADPEAGEAAARGTRMDVVFRDRFTAADPAGAVPADLTAEECDAVGWATDTARILAGDEPLEAREDHLRIATCGMTGTADLLCLGGGWSADLKSGERRNYREQQAAYALGFMEAHFEEEWTVYLLYCDLREVEREHFTREEAEALVRGVIARALDEQRSPTPCDYCGWCAARYRCQARAEAAMPLVPVLEAETPAEAFALVLADNERLGAFLRACKTVKDFDEKARETAKERLIADGRKGKVKIPGVSLVTKKGSAVLPTAALGPVIDALGAEAVLAQLGSLSKAKAEGLFAEAGLELPVERLTETPGTSYVQVR